MNRDEKQLQSSRENGFLDDVSIKDLERGTVNAARLVRRYGMIYWPIVERLQDEVKLNEKRERLLEKLLSTRLTKR